MSIIFDALKRADAQARKGQAPQLAATRTASHARSKARLWALASLFVVLGLSAWWFLGTPTKPTDKIVATTAVKPGATGRGVALTADESAAGQGVPQADLSATKAPALVPSPVVEQSLVVATKLKAAELAANGGTRLSVPNLDSPLTGAAQFDRKSEPVVAAATPVAAAPVLAPATMKPLEPTPVNSPATELVNAKPAEAIVATPVAAAPAVPPPEVSQEPALPSIFELDYQVRHELPKMAVSMYVYNAQQQFRFVIIAGKRYAEGEQIESKVSITKIRADGLECEFQGTRFFYPRQSL